MARAYLCGVPKEHCNGGTIKVNARLGKSLKAHGNRSEAFNCMAHWLVKERGYERVGGREFKDPDGGPRLVLTKRIRYGGELRSGKGMGVDSKRYRPKEPHSFGVITG